MSKCIHCKSENIQFVFNVKDSKNIEYKYHKCNECNTLFISSIPNEEQINESYSNEYYGNLKDEKFSNSVVVKTISFFSKKRAKKLSKLLPNRAKIMDFGCGNGRFLENLSKMGKNFELHGIEINTKAALRAKSRLNNKAWIHTDSDLYTLFNANSFDAISCIHVFEHITEPVNILHEFAELIKPKGILLIVIPNIHSFQYKIFKSKWFHLDPPRHIHFYPPTLLISELQSRGFKLLSVNTFDIEQNPFGLTQSIFNTILSKRDVLYENLKGNTVPTKMLPKGSIFVMKLFWMLLLPLFVLLDLFVSFLKKGACVEMIFEKQ